MNEIIKIENVENLIYEVRGVQVMLDSDLANLYGVDTKRINEAVKNNLEKFPERFSFKLTKDELLILRSKFSTANISSKSRSNPRVFTEQGIYMLSTILKSQTAVKVTIAIMDAFVIMRHYINYSNDMLYNRIFILEDKVDNNTKRLNELFDKFNNKNNSIIYEGKIYDAYSKLLDIFNEAKEEIIIIDNYANKELLDILRNIDKRIIVISKNIDYVLKKKYQEQYTNIIFNIDNVFHDRYIILDKSIVYVSGMSLKDIGKKYSYIYKINEEIFIKELLERIK